MIWRYNYKIDRPLIDKRMAPTIIYLTLIILFVATGDMYAILSEEGSASTS